MMDIAGENMGRKIFLDPIFQGGISFNTVIYFVVYTTQLNLAIAFFLF